MIDLTLFRRPAFVGAQITAFAISSSLFAMFLYLTLYLQDVLRLSPLQTGVRFLPLSLISFFAAPLAGRLIDAVPIRCLLGFGLALVALSLWLMSGISVRLGLDDAAPRLHRRRDRDRPRERAARLDRGLDRPPERAGMASGINNTFRQLGIATGIAALGAIFQTKVGTSTFGTTGHLSLAAKSAFVHGLNAILVVGAVVAAIGAVLALMLVRRQDFVASGPPPQDA